MCYWTTCLLLLSENNQSRVRHLFNDVKFPVEQLPDAKILVVINF